MPILDIWRGGRPRGLLDSWDAFGREFERAFEEMDRFLAPMRFDEASQDMMFKVDAGLAESEHDYLISMDLPGVAKEDVNIEVQGRQLVVSGERKSQQEQNEGQLRRVDRRFGRFQKVFTLPEGSESGKIEARYELGVLYLRIPKSETVKPKRIDIQEGKGGFFKKLIGKDKDKNQSQKHEESKKVS